jgi:hypothetical protein
MLETLHNPAVLHKIQPEAIVFFLIVRPPIIAKHLCAGLSIWPFTRVWLRYYAIIRPLAEPLAICVARGLPEQTLENSCRLNAPLKDAFSMRQYVKMRFRIKAMEIFISID